MFDYNTDEPDIVVNNDLRNYILNETIIRIYS